MALSSLADILAPLSESEFLDEVWCKQFKYISGAPGRFADLLPWDQLNRILSEHRFDAARLRLVSEGVPVAPPSYSRGNGRLIDHEFTAQLRNGATLNLNAVDELYPPLAELAEVVERTLKSQVNINLYAGWRTSKGFNVHWDDHEVIVLQLFGRKHWTIYGTTTPFPIRTPGFETPAPRPTSPQWEHTITAGDLLYMPRGCWHVAVPLDEPSLHLSIGIRQPTGVDFLWWLFERVYRSEAFRMDLPVLVHRAGRAQHAELLRAELQQLCDAEHFEQFLEHRDCTDDMRPHFNLPWSATVNRPALGDDASVRWAAPRARISGNDGGDAMELVARGQRLTFTAEVRPLVDRLVREGNCTVSQLVAEAPGFSPMEVREFVGQLALEGIVTVSDGFDDPHATH